MERNRMSVTIQTYDRCYLEGMTALYNAETAFEPHIAPLTPERFAALVATKRSFDPEGLLVAVEAEKVVGWVHACIAPGSEPWHDPSERVGQVRMLLFPGERLSIGAALVAAATEWLQRLGETELLALHARRGYPFYRGLWLGSEPMGPATMPHVQLALEVGGFKTTQKSIFMVAEMREPLPEAAPSIPIEFVEAPAEMAHDGMSDSWTGFTPMRIEARVAGETAGSVGWVLLPHVADRLGAPVVNIWTLGVREAYRRRGIAAALVSRSMAHGYVQGARFASVGTQLWNDAAHATYTKLGFRPHTMLVGRTYRAE
jgi:GNAT superfamily N-acetyltransferase